MSRTRAERRHNDWKKAIRKRNICLDGWDHSDRYDNLHQYSKNKIHCSCCLCGSKTKNKGKRRQRPYNYMPSYNPTIPMLRRIDEMNYELWEEIE